MAVEWKPADPEAPRSAGDRPLAAERTADDHLQARLRAETPAHDRDSATHSVTRAQAQRGAASKHREPVALRVRRRGRAFLADHPSLVARLERFAARHPGLHRLLWVPARLAWWTITLQLPQRIAAAWNRRRAPADPPLRLRPLGADAWRAGPAQRATPHGDPAGYDVFIDDRQSGRDSGALAHDLARLAREAGPQVHVVDGLPATDALERAIRTAARARRHLVVLLGPVRPGAEIIAELIAGFAQDPMLGTAQPRFAAAATDRIWPLPATDTARDDASTTSRATLRALPPDTITPELVACCLVLRWELLIGVAMADLSGHSLVGGLLHVLAYARRLGFRNLVRNRTIVVAALPYADVYPAAPAAEVEALYAADPSAAGSLEEIAALPQRRLEALAEAACPAADGRRRLLLDCRGLTPLHNGTTVCILGFLDGFARLGSDWDIDVLAPAEASAHHGLPRRYPRFRHRAELASARYAAAVLLAQPWGIDHVAELHRHARVIAFLMLDTIGWDIAPGRLGVEAAWSFIARHADGLMYISDFTRGRFNRRFPVAADTAEAVARLSLAREDYAPAAEPPGPIGRQILIFGNHYDHKHVAPTAHLLADAFPSHEIVALGMAHAPGRNVTALESGQLQPDRLDRLIAGAGVVVFPSFYEGFGLPVVESLARGRTVLVRRSALWAEIAAHSRLPGRLCEFDDPASLVDGVRRALAGLPMAALPSGTSLAPAASPDDWKASAQRIDDLLAGLLARPRLDRWWAREQALQLLRP
jgi:glycosyltransferase involved in cell wall biosynthesis